MKRVILGRIGKSVRLALSLIFVLVMTSIITAQIVENPDSVTIAGTVQSVLGCPGDWQPECDATFLTYNANADIWTGSFDLPAGSYEYKAALNSGWDWNFGANAAPGGENITLELTEDSTVTFYFDVKTGWITDDVNSLIVTAPGSYQSLVGCAGDWDPSCLISWMQDPDGDGVYVLSLPIVTAGDYEAKVALGLSWDVNFGADGQQDGADISFNVPEDNALITFAFDSATNAISIEAGDVVDVVESMTPSVEEVTDVPTLPSTALDNPEMVVVPGTIQSVLGCPGDWQPECEATALTYIEEYDIWRGSFDIPAGSYQYKVALNGTWDVNFGADAVPSGADITLELEEDTTVDFLFDYKTGWVMDTVNFILANVPGSFQSEVGCVDTNGNGGDWEPACLRTWLQDPDSDGIYVYSTSALPAGNYESKVAVNESWGENYGAGGARDGADISFTVPEDNVLVSFVWDSASGEMTIDISSDIVIVGNIGFASAHWITADTIAWNVDIEDGATYLLNYSPEANLSLAGNGIDGGDALILTYNPDGLSADLAEKFPYLANYDVFNISEADVALVPEILRGQFAVSALNADSAPIDATGVQIPGVLDDLYAFDGDLGAVLNEGVPTVSLWAPTAQNVRFHLFDDSNPTSDSTVVDMIRDDATGVWSITGEADWIGKYYLYEVQVYAPSTRQIETNIVTDPYSLSLAMNSTRSQIVDMNDPALMPEGWDALVKPPLEAPEDIVVYELHIRDFSVTDEIVPEELRGTYMAFTLEDSAGVNHLESLADAGLTHLHLLPSFDLATINENASGRTEPDFDVLASFAPDSDEQQALINPIRDEDGFNWGYDPFHYTVPEGSYSTNPDGSHRILEFREMVLALNEMGLRVVIDVVYNHTSDAGQSPRSVLDRVVPGYYHRLNPQTGNIETSSCCPNTASENHMMERLLIDSSITWAVDYKVDAFRFDLMGSHLLSNMENLRAELDALTLESDGVDGSSIYVYGEGWTRPDTDGNVRGVPAVQLTIGGTGIGVFNDRLRDAVRGGSPFDGRQNQGWISNLYFNPNGITPGDEAAQLQQLHDFAQLIRVGLAGNLANYVLLDGEGQPITGADVPYGGGSPAGYTLDPQENIIYVSKHDNETLWDILMYKDLEGVTLEDYVRMQNLGNSIVMFSQGIPFFQAGDDLLRSKSMDRNSYNSGDWFNQLDWTYQTNGFGIGLPPNGDNGARWDIMRPILADESLMVSSDHLENSRQHFLEILQVRQDVRLFRLQTGEQVVDMLNFHNMGVDEIPGLIVMSVTDADDFDPQYEVVVTLFNSSPEEVSFTEADLIGVGLELHPILVNSHDPIAQTSAFDVETGTFTIPGRTTAVFVLRQ